MDIRSFFGGSKPKPVEKPKAAESVTQVVKKEPEKEIRKSPKRIPSQKKQVTEDDMIIDSDEDADTSHNKNTKPRGRLISKNESKNTQNEEKSKKPSPKKSLKRGVLKKSETDLSDFDSEPEFVDDEDENEVSDDDFADSSDEEGSKKRKKKPIKATKPKANTPKKSPLKRESPNKLPNSGTKKQKGNQEEVILIDEEPKETKTVLPLLDKTKKLTSPIKKVKELTGGAAEYFGKSTSTHSTIDLSTSSPQPTGSLRNTPSGASTDTGATSEVKKESTPKKRSLPASLTGSVAPGPATAPTVTPSAAAPAPAKQSGWRYGHSRGEGGGRAGGALGQSSKTPPNGAPGCLDGLKIAVTGEFEGFSREEVEGLVGQYGGKVASNVSGKTNYLVVGARLEDGRDVTEGSKYRNAKEKKVKILTEDEFLALIQASNPTDAPIDWNAPSPSLSASAAAPATSSSTPSPRSSAATTPGTGGGKMSVKSSQVATGTASLKGAGAGTEGGGEEGQLWVDKYKPSAVTDIIGCNDTVTKLRDWLTKWEAVHLRQTLKIPYTKENPGAKAVLLSGPPGIGKTTMATVVSRALGYELLELNASDVRNKNSIVEHVSDVVLSRALGPDGQTRRRVVVMDEVDGMGSSDRGGIPELIKVIKSSRSPIICICNDRQSQKIRSLANHCYDLRVRRPMKNQIAQRAVQIAAREGLQVDQNAAEMLVEQVGNDIRQVLHAMQMWSAQSAVMRFTELKSSMHRIEKDKVLRQSPFDACGLILGGMRSEPNLNTRFNSFFIDYSLVPLLLQQNYVDSSKSGIFKSARMDDVGKMDALAQAADAVSDMELASVYSNDMAWELLPVQAMFACRVGHIVEGFQPFPSFPAWLGKSSSKGKAKRLTNEIVVHTSLFIGQGFTGVRMDYIPYLRHTLLHLLLQHGQDGVGEVLCVLEAYGLSKDDFSETMKELQFVIADDKVFADKFDLVDSKVKAALTREYNSMEHHSQALVSEQGLKKGKRSKASTGDEGDMVEGGLDSLTGDIAAAKAVEEEKEEDVDISEFVRSKTKRKGKATPATSSTASTSATAAKTKVGGKGKGRAK